MNRGGAWLVAGGVLSLIAASLHLACILFGAEWYRFFGAPAPLIESYQNGSMTLVWMTGSIALILAVWGAYAFSGAGMIGRLPFLRIGLVAIAVIYLARGLFLIPAIVNAPYPGSTFDLWSSTIVLVYGLAYAIGTWLAWNALRPQRAITA